MWHRTEHLDRSLLLSYWMKLHLVWSANANVSESALSFTHWKAQRPNCLPPGQHENKMEHAQLQWPNLWLPESGFLFHCHRVSNSVAWPPPKSKQLAQNHLHCYLLQVAANATKFDMLEVRKQKNLHADAQGMNWIYNSNLTWSALSTMIPNKLWLWTSHCQHGAHSIESAWTARPPKSSTWVEDQPGPNVSEIVSKHSHTRKQMTYLHVKAWVLVVLFKNKRIPINKLILNWITNSIKKWSNAPTKDVTHKPGQHLHTDTEPSWPHRKQAGLVTLAPIKMVLILYYNMKIWILRGMTLSAAVTLLFKKSNRARKNAAPNPPNCTWG